MRTLLNGIVDVSREAELCIRGLSMDSRTLVPGDLFLACRGLASHGASPSGPGPGTWCGRQPG